MLRQEDEDSDEAKDESMRREELKPDLHFGDVLRGLWRWGMLALIDFGGDSVDGFGMRILRIPPFRDDIISVHTSNYCLLPFFLVPRRKMSNFRVSVYFVFSWSTKKHRVETL